MLNDIEIYRAAGVRAGTAMKRRDMGLYDHEKRWFSQAKSMEKEQDRQAVQDAWNEGYAEGNPKPSPQYFR